MITILPRYQQPSSLMHQSRLTIRKALLGADHLPGGIPQLPLPTYMHRYIDLLMD